MISRKYHCNKLATHAAKYIKKIINFYILNLTKDPVAK